MFRRFFALLALLLAATPLQAQSLRGKLSELFVLGPATEPLQVLGPLGAGGPAVGITINRGFEPAAVQANGTILTFLTNWVSGNVANLPIGTATGGSTFRFEGGVPVETPVSSGPIFAEAARTVGFGRVIAGATYSGLQFSSIRGVPLDNLRFNFTHQDAGSASPAANDVIELRLGLDLDLAVYSLFMTAGVSDRVDLGVVVPIVQANLQGNSEAQVLPFGSSPEEPASTFIAGTPYQPVLSSSQSVQGSATGLGDIAARLKINLLDREQVAFAIVGDARLPTGDANDLLGTGALSVRGLGVLSARWNNFSPHLNVGYRYWDSNSINDAVLATVGFDQLLAPWATFAASLVSELQVGESVYRLPDPVTITEPFPRTIRPAEIPDIRDDAVSVSLGFKLATVSGVRAVIHSLVPVTRGGPRPDLAWTLRAEYDF